MTDTKNNTTLKMVAIAALALVLLIPAGLIGSLISERQGRRDSVVGEINGKWGGNQTITGPYITLPYNALIKETGGKKEYALKNLNILPERLNITGVLKPEVRYRSIFEAVLYNSKLNFSGHFKVPSAGELGIDPASILWNKAYLSVGITDMRGIKDRIKLKFNDTSYDANPGVHDSAGKSGVSAMVNTFSPSKPNKFSFNLNLNGSQAIQFIPVGETNIVDIRSSWPSPSFNGAFLPTKHTVNKDGFSAHWKILHLNRSYPQVLKGEYDLAPSTFGLELILTADIYQKSIRLVKYAILFIVFTFSALFFSEIINKRRLHPIQYSLIGLAILLFYTLLLSISEYINFNGAYLISAAAIAIMISTYGKAILKSNKFALTIFGMLTILYAYLFIILQLEDYALIMGSVGLLIVLGVVMYTTRRINWYSIDIDQS